MLALSSHGGERAGALDAPAGVLDTLSAVVSKPPALRRVLADEPFGHCAHPMLVQIPIGAWVSAGWLDCLPAPSGPPPS